MRRLTQEEFIRKCIEKHSDRYDYSLSKYLNSRSKIEIICKTHGLFTQNSKNHLDGQGCSKCANNCGWDKKDFVIHCEKLYNHKYDYSLIPAGTISKYVLLKDGNLIYSQCSQHHKNGLTPTKILGKSLPKVLSEIHNGKFTYEICKEYYRKTDKIKIINRYNDSFMYRIDRHLMGMSPNKVVLNSLLEKCLEIHSNKYDYSLVKSVNKKMPIICKSHGVFFQDKYNHMKSQGCPKCSKYSQWKLEDLIKEFSKIHNNEYDYPLVADPKIKSKKKIICKNHGIFQKSVHKHLGGQGCPNCTNNSNGERIIREYLNKNDIKYESEKTFDGCIDVGKLRFDFYIPSLNTCIEYDGIQHFKQIERFGGENSFLETIKRDSIKNKYCEDKNISLLRIKYDQVSNIYDILKNNLQG